MPTKPITSRKPRGEIVAPAWMARASCRDSPYAQIWFSGDKRDEYAAKFICAGCDVNAECLAYALEHEIVEGVWGGMDERQRAKLLRPK